MTFWSIPNLSVAYTPISISLYQIYLSQLKFKKIVLFIPSQSWVNKYLVYNEGSSSSSVSNDSSQFVISLLSREKNSRLLKKTMLTESGRRVLEKCSKIASNRAFIFQKGEGKKMDLFFTTWEIRKVRGFIFAGKIYQSRLFGQQHNCLIRKEQLNRKRTWDFFKCGIHLISVGEFLIVELLLS